MISRRARHLLQEPPPLVVAHMRCAADRFDPRDNPDGYINFGTAENYLIQEQVLAQVQRETLQLSDLHYGNPAGSEALRHAFSDFQQVFLGVESLPADRIVVSSGVSALLEALSYCLLDAADEILTFAPVYSGFWHDLEARFGGRLRCSGALDGDRIDFERLRADLAKHRQLRALLICNPHNPFGICLHPDDLHGLLELAREQGLEVIADEVYANSVFGDRPFVSCLDPRFDALGWREHVHQLYGLAKDFGLSGFKTAFFASHDEELARAMAECAYFHTVSGQTQRTATRLLRDQAFCAELFALSRQRLAANFAALHQGLRALDIPVHASHAGIFTLIDLSAALGIDSAAAELAAFARLLDEARINITPGGYFAHPQPGFFRVCYAQPQDRIDAFLQRLGRLTGTARRR